jgi:hypothetical protein
MAARKTQKTGSGKKKLKVNKDAIRDLEPRASVKGGRRIRTPADPGGEKA